MMVLYFLGAFMGVDVAYVMTVEKAFVVWL